MIYPMNRWLLEVLKRWNRRSSEVSGQRELPSRKIDWGFVVCITCFMKNLWLNIYWCIILLKFLFLRVRYVAALITDNVFFFNKWMNNFDVAAFGFVNWIVNLFEIPHTAYPTSIWCYWFIDRPRMLLKLLFKLITLIILIRIRAFLSLSWTFINLMLTHYDFTYLVSELHFLITSSCVLSRAAALLQAVLCETNYLANQWSIRLSLYLIRILDYLRGWFLDQDQPLPHLCVLSLNLADVVLQHHHY